MPISYESPPSFAIGSHAPRGILIRDPVIESFGMTHIMDHERQKHERKLDTLIFDTRKGLSSRADLAEEFEYEKLYFDKINVAKEVQAYFQ